MTWRVAVCIPHFISARSSKCPRKDADRTRSVLKKSTSSRKLIALIVYGRVFPPSSVADPERIPDFLGILGPDGPIGVSTDVSIVERDAGGRPQEVEITARSA